MVEDSGAGVGADIGADTGADTGAGVGAGHRIGARCATIQRVGQSILYIKIKYDRSTYYERNSIKCF